MTVSSLWGEEFTVDDSQTTQKILNKIKKPKEVKKMTTEQLLKSKTVSVEDKLATIREEVHRILGKFEEDTILIKSYEELKSYIDAAIYNGIIAIDTETNNTVNTFDCKLMGLCIYTPGQKNAYVPVNHVNRETNEKLSWQVTESQIGEQLQRLLDNQVFEVYHNAIFDIEVLKTTCDIRLHADWDTMVGAQLLNENELKGLKTQYKLHIDPEQDKYDIEHLFKGLPYEIIEPELFALYAATDSKITYQLYEYQRAEFKKPDMEDVYNLFQTVEIPILDVVVNMELTGVEVDLDYASKMSKIYHERSDEIQKEVDKELEYLKPLIDEWRQTPEANNHPVNKAGTGYSKSKNEQLSDPPDLGSPTQMAIMLYDVLKAPVIDKKAPRGTGADILEELASKFHICKLLVDKRGVDILINTFIDAIPTYVQKDGRVHARFNTTGTQTGRFSSSNPNLQNIPSHDKTIRMIFKASKGYSICGSDYSGQEVRALASLAEDKEMIKAYEAGRDLYAQIGALAFHTEYENCLEFDPRNGGVLNPEGKARRSRAKTLLLGLNYGMGVTTLAERIGESKEEAQHIIDEFYKGFTGVKKFTEDSQEMLKKKGYITDAFGRRRHIPDGMLPEYDIKVIGGDNFDFNPLIGAEKHVDNKTKVLIDKYRDKLSKAKWKKDKDAIIEQAKKEGLEIHNNGGYINRALRQCLNARIQGTSASMTKMAMVMIDNDKELNDLGFKLLITVHDEVFGECPTENSERAAKRLCEVMVEAAKIKCGKVPWKCDPYILKRWYADEASGEVLKDYKKFIKGDIKHDIEPLSPEESYEKIKVKYSMIQEKYLRMMCDGNYDPNIYSDI